jgi:hypothetical protein
VLSRVVVAVFAIAIAAAPELAAQASSLDSTRVLVSRRELRAVFAAETTHHWGWPRRDRSANSAHYAWVISVGEIDGPRELTFDVWQANDSARMFSSLKDVAAAGRAQLCKPGMVRQCSDVGMRAAVEGERVVLTLRDSATIMRLFAMRPATVNIYRVVRMRVTNPVPSA